MRVSAAALVLLFTTLVLAAEQKTAPVTRGTLTVAVRVSGRIDAERSTPVVLSPAAWRGTYQVLEALEPGTLVNPGDVVMRIDDRALRDEVERAGFEYELAQREARIQLERQSLGALARAGDLANREFELRAAEKHLTGYVEYELAHSRRRAELDAAASQFGVDNSKSELEQLEKMYSDDELVDETEDIVLGRARFDLKNRMAHHQLRLDQRAFAVEFHEQPTRKSLEFKLAQRKEAFERALRSEELSKESDEIAALRLRRSLEKKKVELERLTSDLAGMTVRAPVGGVLLHGPLEGALSRRFDPGTRINTAEAAVTIADPGSLAAVLYAPAAEILRLRVGQRAAVTVSAKEAGTFEGVVTTLAPLPRGGKLRVLVRPDRPLPRELLGIEVSARLVLAEVEDALLVPLKAVTKKGGKAFVTKVGAAEPVAVSLGRDDGTSVVVVEGLAEGDEVVLEPEPEK